MRWKMLDVYPWERISPIDIVQIKAKLQELRNRKNAPFTPNSIDKHIFSLRGLLKFCMLAGLITDIEFKVIQRIASRAGGSRIAKGRSLTVEEVNQLLEACDLSTNRGVRDFAIIAVLHAAGLRRDEVGTIQFEAYDRDGMTIRVIGKGNKEREVRIQPETVEAIDRWLKARGQSAGPLFPRLAAGRGNKIMLGKRISSQAVFRVLLDLVNKAGITRCAPHDLRRTFATDSWEAGVDLHMLKEEMGHARVDTTLGYLRRNKKAKSSAAEALAAYRKKQEEEAAAAAAAKKEKSK